MKGSGIPVAVNALCFEVDRKITPERLLAAMGE